MGSGEESDKLVIDFARNIGQGEESSRLGSKGKKISTFCIVKWLYAETIAGQPKFTVFSVVKSDGEVAVQFADGAFKTVPGV